MHLQAGPCAFLGARQAVAGCRLKLPGSQIAFDKLEQPSDAQVFNDLAHSGSGVQKFHTSTRPAIGSRGHVVRLVGEDAQERAVHDLTFRQVEENSRMPVRPEVPQEFPKVHAEQTVRAPDNSNTGGLRSHPDK
jgi:hypothetical protein